MLRQLFELGLGAQCILKKTERETEREREKESERESIILARLTIENETVNSRVHVS